MYKLKYLKYKNKYLSLVNQTGGAPCLYDLARLVRYADVVRLKTDTKERPTQYNVHRIRDEEPRVQIAEIVPLSQRRPTPSFVNATDLIYIDNMMDAYAREEPERKRKEEKIEQIKTILSNVGNYNITSALIDDTSSLRVEDLIFRDDQIYRIIGINPHRMNIKQYNLRTVPIGALVQIYENTVKEHYRTKDYGNNYGIKLYKLATLKSSTPLYADCIEYIKSL